MTRDSRSRGSTTLVFGIGFAVFASIAFFLANAGINPISNHRFRGINPDQAPGIGILVLFFFSAVAAFIWHAFAMDTGNPGTVWGDLTSSPLPALALLFGLWATANLSLALGAIADAFHRTLWAVFLVVSVVIAILAITIGVVASNILTMSPVAALAVTVICLIIATAALVPARLFAVARDRVTTRLDAAYEARMQSLLTALAPGENLVLHFADRGNPDGRILAATNQRLLLAAPTSTGTGPTRPGQVRILDQAHPGQLRGASTKFRRAGHTTSVHFRDRPDMELIGGDPSEADKFAEALTSLATTGRLPQEEDT
ncbi:MAG: hypothetical protein ACQEVD_11985 [Actinomycetota bacterium]